MSNSNNIPSFASVGGLSLWCDTWGGLIGNDDNLPYVIKDGMYHYFTFDGTHYNLQMTSSKDLQEKK